MSQRHLDTLDYAQFKSCRGRYVTHDVLTLEITEE